MTIRLFAVLLTLSLVFTGCHDATAELFHGSDAAPDACCSADGAADAHAAVVSEVDACCRVDADGASGSHAAMADAAHEDCGDCGDCGACGGRGDCCADCGDGAACSADSDCCADCGDCCACCSDAVDTAKQKLEELAPAGLGEDG